MTMSRTPTRSRPAPAPMFTSSLTGITVELDIGWIDAAIRLGIGALMVWVATTVQKLTVEVRAIAVHVWGHNGDNGQNSIVKRLEQQMSDSIEERAQMRTEIALIRASVDTLTRKVS